ncbi:MAG: dUTP diphosphatase [Clostridia bacterium]|nr:dUTP diphosphatase [Clostridia bacterium]
METLKIKKIRENAVVPKRATEGSAGMDLYACIDAPVTVKPHECVKFPTGIAIALPSADYGAFVFARSGLSINHGLAPANCVGVVDSDYRGEVIVGLVNQFSEPYTVEPGERIAQMVIMPVSLMPTEECDCLDETDRGEGGFGSTGKK